MGSDDFVSVEIFSDGPSVWPDTCTGGGGTSVATLGVDSRVAKPFSASSIDGCSSIEMVDEFFGRFGRDKPLLNSHPLSSTGGTRRNPLRQRHHSQGGQNWGTGAGLGVSAIG